MTFCTNWRSESHTWLGGVNEFLILVSIFVWHVWVKFDTEDLHVMPFINYAFTKTSRLNNIPFLMSKIKSCAIIYKFLSIGIKFDPEGVRNKFSVHEVSWKPLSGRDFTYGRQLSALVTFIVQSGRSSIWDICNHFVHNFCENCRWEGHTFLTIIKDITFTRVPYNLECKELLGKICVPRDIAYHSQSCLFI